MGFHYRGLCLLCMSFCQLSIHVSSCPFTRCLSVLPYIPFVHCFVYLVGCLACPSDKASFCASGGMSAVHLSPAFLLLHLFADQSISLCIWVNSCYRHPQARLLPPPISVNHSHLCCFFRPLQSILSCTIGHNARAVPGSIKELGGRVTHNTESCRCIQETLPPVLWALLCQSNPHLLPLQVTILRSLPSEPSASIHR